MRFFKTRTKAAEACQHNRIFIDAQSVKPSRLIKPGVQIQLKHSGFNRTIEVLQLSEHRLSAKFVPEYCKDLTPQKEIDAFKARMARASAYRDPGTGRPTKKDRRELDDFTSAVDDLFEE